MKQATTQMLLEHLKLEEGFSPTVYSDTTDHLTIGYGWNLDNRPMTEREASFVLEDQVTEINQRVCRELRFYWELPEPVKLAVVAMAFQLGLNGLLGFKKMLHALQCEDWERASREALDSKWAKQTPARAKRVAALIWNAGEES